jgi:tetratricopeptide (TPR) repeat protein
LNQGKKEIAHIQMKSFRNSKSKHLIYAFATAGLLSAFLGSNTTPAGALPSLSKTPLFGSKAKPLDADKLLEKGRQLFNAGQYNPASEEFRQIVEKNPQSGVCHFEYARALARLGNEDKAVSEFLEALNHDATLMDARKEMAVVFMKRGSFDEAGGQLKQVVDAYPEDMVSRGNLAICMQNVGLLDQAIEQLRIVHAKNPNSVEALYNLGIALRQKGLIDEAKEKFAQILLLKPRPDESKLSFTYLELGRCLLQKNDKNATNNASDIRSAVGLEKLAIKYLPSNHWAYLALGEALEKEGKETEALEAFRQAIQINPKAPESRAALTRLLNGKAAAQKQKLTVR